MSRGSGAVRDRGRVANGDINYDTAAGGRVNTQVGTEVSFTELAGSVHCPGCDGLGPVGGSGGSGAASAAVPFAPAVGGMNNIKLSEVVRSGEGDPIERANSGLELDTMGGVGIGSRGHEPGCGAVSCATDWQRNPERGRGGPEVPAPFRSDIGRHQSHRRRQTT